MWHRWYYCTVLLQPFIIFCLIKVGSTNNNPLVIWEGMVPLAPSAMTSTVHYVGNKIINYWWAGGGLKSMSMAVLMCVNIFCREGKSQYGGQLPRPSPSASSPAPLMFGVWELFYGRWWAMENDHIGIGATKMLSRALRRWALLHCIVVHLVSHCCKQYIWRTCLWFYRVQMRLKRWVFNVL